MRARIVWSTVLSIIAVAAAPASGQYSRTPGDTLHYAERTIGTVVMHVPTGPVTVRTEHDALLGLTFGEGDAATAWYEQLHLEQNGPAGQHQRPGTSELLDRPFVLSFDSRGRVVTRSAPEIPADITAMTDLTRQFDDFFISLPLGELETGREWSDTLVHEEPGRAQDSFTSRRVRSFIVDRDTVVEGADAVLIRVRQDVTVEAGSPLEAPGMKATTILRGTETGIAVFVPSEGQLVKRTRSGYLDGEVEISGGPDVMKIPQVYEYESSIVLRQ